MGLFSNKKKLCPICGEPTPLVFSTKVENVPLCKACSGKIFLPDGVLETMTMEDFRAYMNYYEENQALRDKFQPTYEYPVGFSWMTLRLDTKNGLFSMHGADNALVFDKSCIETYRILEDDEPLFQGNKKAIKFFESKVPERVRSLAPMISQYEIQKREYEMMERMDDILNRDDDNDNRYRTHRYHIRPTFDAQEPFRSFNVRVRLEHPYWKGIHQGKIGGPTFSNYDPSIENYMYEYNRTVDALHDLALQFKALVNPKSKEIYDGEKVETPITQSVAQVVPQVDTVEELKKYKGLLDAGIITEEEFAAKKKQLLGI